MILLDTHAWLWWLQDPSQLSSTALNLIQAEEPQNGILVSSISVWEIAVKVSLGKLQLHSLSTNGMRRPSNIPALLLSR